MRTTDPRHQPDHDHAIDLEVVLDFLNTLRYDDGVASDKLADPDVAVDVLDRAGTAHRDALHADAAADPAGWLQRVRSFRAALREAYDAQVDRRSPDAAAIDVLNASLRARPYLELRAGLGGLGVGHRHVEDATAEALARLATPFVAAIAAGEAARFRICANDGCRWVFRDGSRAGRRRWCDMSSCGNRAKVARYRSRRRAAEGDIEGT